MILKQFSDNFLKNIRLFLLSRRQCFSYSHFLCIISLLYGFFVANSSFSLFFSILYSKNKRIFHNRIMIENFEKNQAQNPQDVCSLHFYYPTRENLSKYLKITKFSLENYDWIPPLYMQHQRNCKKLHPQINFDWFAKRDFRVEPKIVYLMCRDVFDYRCKARLVYQFDHDDQCFYLKDCNNQHYHILPGNAFYKVIWQQKKQKMQKLANETRGLQRREEEQNERKEVQHESKRIERREDRQKQMMQKLRTENKNRKKPQVIISKVFKK